MFQWISKSPLPLIYMSLIVLCLYYALYTQSLLAILVFGLLICLLIYQHSVQILLRFVPFLLLMFTWFSYQVWQSERIQQDPLENVQTVRVLPDTIKVNGDSLSFRGKSQGRMLQVYYKLKTQEEKETFQQLSDISEIELEGELSLPEQGRNFGGFDYRAYLKTQGIYQSLTIKRIQSLTPSHSWDVKENLSSLRKKGILWIKNHFPAPMSSYMTGLLLGYLDTDFEEMDELYSSLGIIHLFALSGMQVAFFVDTMKKILLRLGMTQERFQWFLFPFAFFYAGITGFSASVIRSLVQKVLAQYGFKGLTNFAATILVLFFLMPSFFLTAGGILSCAYAFILTMTSSKESSGFSGFVRESLVISIGILPILSFYFGEFQPWSILLTFLFSFLFDLVFLPLLSIVFLFSFVYPLTVFNVLFEWLEIVIRLVAQLASKPLVLGQPSVYILFFLLVFLALLYDARHSLKKATVLACLVFALFFVSKHPLENEITVIDIGQGDSIFLRDKQGKTVLIDVGGRLELGKKEAWQVGVRKSNAERTLIPYLKSRGVAHIDKLVLTHTDTDHVGDLLELAKKIDIKEIYTSKGSVLDREFLSKLKETKSSIHLIERGDEIPIFDSQLQVLYPSGVGDGGNDDSIVLYGDFFGTRFLFTGDLEEKGERELLTLYPNLKADVLKAGHHGSKGSSTPEFLASIEPKITLISAGQNNRYKHPHKETLERLKAVDSRIYRTDQQGAIRFRGWNSWKVETVR